MTRMKGAIAVCSLGTLGLITEEEPRTVTYRDSTESRAWVGIHLTGRTAPVGSAWSSRHPVVVAHTDTLGAQSAALRALESGHPTGAPAGDDAGYNRAVRDCVQALARLREGAP